MASARKYGFETEFAVDGKVLSEPAAARRFSKEELEKESADAYERGKKDALAQAERDAAKALQMLAQVGEKILRRLDEESTAMREEAARVALASARKIADIALDHYGAARAQAAIESAMDALRHQPRLMVKLAAATAEALRPRIVEMAEKHAYAGAILIRDEVDLKVGDVVIDWTDGVLSLDSTDIAARVDALVTTALAKSQGADA